MILKKNKYYYYRWQIPIDLRARLGKRELIKSLRVRNKSAAIIRAARLEEIIDKIKQLRYFYQAKELTAQNYKESIELLWKQAEAEQFTPPCDTHNEHRDSLESEIKLYKDYAHLFPGCSHEYLTDSIDCTCMQGRGNEFLDDTRYEYLRKNLEESLKCLGVICQDKSAQYCSVARYTELQRSTLENLNEDYSRFRRPAFARTHQNISSNENLIEETPFFSDAHNSFIGYKMKGKAPLAIKNQKNYQRYLADWIELEGDCCVGNIKRKNVRSFLEKLLQLPKRNLKQYKGKNVSALLHMSTNDEIPEEDLVAPKTVGEHKKWLSGVFAYLRDQEEIIEKSPIDKLGLKLVSEYPYAIYENVEVLKLISESKNERLDWMNWVVILGAYTGARLGEIVQLRKRDIQLDLETKRYFMEITDEGIDQKLKNKQSKRKVPLHGYIVNSGFIDFVENQEDKVFSGLSSKRATQWFNGFKVNCGISSKADLRGQRKVFHSFRHTVTTALRSAGILDVWVQQLLGHNKRGAGMTDRYTHEIDFSSLCKAIDKINY